MAVALGLAVGSTLAGCSSTFSCQEDSQCEQNGQAGICQPATGFCSFPSDDCDSGQQYGDLAPDGLAGTCVPATNETDSPASTTTSDAEGSSSSTVEPTTGSGEATSMPIDPGTSGTTASTDPSGVTTTAGESSGSTGGEPACCNAGCAGTCAEGARCTTELVGSDPPQNSEAIGVAVVGESVVWSTGFGRSLMLADPDAGIDTELVSIPENSFVTRIAADGTHVYFVDWGGPTVQRVSVPDGEVDLVTTVAAGQAGFGGIAVDDTHVYFAMRTTGGVWRAAKDLSNQKNAQLVAMAESPFGVAVDDENLFFIDTAAGAVLRLELDSLGEGEQPPEVVVNASGLTAIAVDDEFLYYGAAGVLNRADKLGTNQGVVMLAAGLGNIWNVDVDDAHAYVSLASSDEVGRIPKEGGSYESLAVTDQPWGLALGCTDVFWAENGTQTLQRRQK